MKKKNYKLFVGIIVGIIISSGIVLAASYKGAANNIKYNNKNSWLYSSNVQDALDELYEGKNCPSKTFCIPYKFELAEGDYVSYTPEIESYSTDPEYTGWDTIETIYPSELNLWRVLNVNSDGTIELISEYVSSTGVTFYGATGYLNYVGYLNMLADQYKTEGITVDARHFGYNGQTEFIEDTDPTSIFVNPAPFTCSTGGTCSPDPDDNEDKGGGDTLYTTDYNKVESVLGTRKAYEVGKTTFANYWMASRNYRYGTSFYIWQLRLMSIYNWDTTFDVYKYGTSGFVGSNQKYHLRPIVKLKSGLSYEGLGTIEHPMRIVVD